jgi:hypothetical protein
MRAPLRVLATAFTHSLQQASIRCKTFVQRGWLRQLRETLSSLGRPLPQFMVLATLFPLDTSSHRLTDARALSRTCVSAVLNYRRATSYGWMGFL